MKSKLTSFLMLLITILAITIIVFIGLIVYSEFMKPNIADEVEEFVSNVTISNGKTNEKKEATEIIETLSDSLTDIEESKDYSDSEINKYFYNQLEDYSKIIYNAMETNKENLKTGTYEIDLGTQFSSLLSKSDGEKLLGDYYQSAIEAYTYDNPEVFYIDFGKMYLNMETTTRGKKVTYRVFINSGNSESYLTDEFDSKDTIDEAISEIRKIKAYFIQNKKVDTYDNIKLVHDYLVESMEYEQTTSQANIYDLYGALVNKKSVCEGYAKAFKYLMDALEIPCTIVIGEATNSEGNMENHAWNYVQLNGTWYAVDCTWDDPIIIGPGFLTNLSKYKYFLKGENEFNKNHVPNGQFTENGKIFEYPSLSQANFQ